LVHFCVAEILTRACLLWVKMRRTRIEHILSALPVRRDKAALSSGCESHPANAPAGSNRSSYGGDEVAEAFG
jgi:hypothetical protein